MTEFRVQVVRLGKIGKHPNADTLSITQVHGNYPVIVKTGAFNPGDLAVHIPPDALVPVDRPEFSWLADKAHNGLFRVRYSKLRGVPSYGFLVPVPGTPNGAEALSEGQDVRHLLGVTKYDPGPCFSLEGSGEMFTCPVGDMVPHYDIEGLRKYERLFTPGEKVWVTEKIHGANGKWVYVDGELYCGSRTKFRKDSVWNRMAEKYGLSHVLSKHPGLVLYGEVFGPGIQDLTYGLKEPEVRFFDLYDTTKGKWLNYRSFKAFCVGFELPEVPTLKVGPFDLQECYQMAEGKSTIADHVREGIVVKPVEERWNMEIGRVFLKLPGEGFLLRSCKNDKVNG